MKPFFRLEHPVAVAHRGGGLLWPENTMAAFRGADELGLRYIETDLHATSDGVLVAMHDHTLDRTTDGHGPIWERAWEDLEAVDAGHRFAPEQGYPWRGKGLRIPRLDEVVRELPDTLFTLELKQDGIEPLVVDLISRHELWDRVLVASFKDRRLLAIRRQTQGRVATSAGEREVGRVWGCARIGIPLRTPADALQIPIRRGRVVLANRRMVWAAHATGRQVHVWTIDEPAEMRRLLDLGVDGLISDRPDLLQKVLGARGVWWERRPRD